MRRSRVVAARRQFVHGDLVHLVGRLVAPPVLCLVVACGAAAAAAESGVPLGATSVLVWATVDEGAALLGGEDAFTRRLSPIDRQARLRRGAAVSDRQYREFAARAVLPWTEAEKRHVTDALAGLAARLEACHIELPPRVLLVKTSGDEEGGAAYTRGNAVVLPRRVLASPPRNLRRLLCHEFFHVLSRHRPDLRERLYAAIGFVPCGDVVLPGPLEARRLTNPDAPAFDHAIRVRCDGVERWMVPVLFFRDDAPAAAAAGRPFLASMQFRLLAVDIAGMPPRGTPVLDDAGAPILRTPDDVEGFFEQTGRNTGYLIHPEEIVADNVALLVTAADTDAPEPPQSPAVLARVAAVLAGGAAGAADPADTAGPAAAAALAEEAAPDAASAAPATAPAAGDAALVAWAAAEVPALVELYRHFHAHPELSLQERETAARVASEWEAAGFTVTRSVGGHGVVGLLENGAGPTLMLRTDLDALPVVERTGLAYASQVRVPDRSGNEVGVMHACGHDVHMTCLIGAARYLASRRDGWRGRLMLVGQPAEERVMGAQAMLDDGLFTRFPKPDFAVALHCDANLAAGAVGCRAGYALANSDSVDVALHGKGGHGAYPHTTVDPIVQAAQFILALQTIVSREVPPTEPAVITVGSIQAGTKHNIIGDRCDLQLTVRSYTDEVRGRLLAAIERKARGIALSMNAPEPTVTVTEGTPALFNDDALNARLEGVFRRVLGDSRVTLGERSMGGEDFSRYGRAGVPIVMFRLGTVAQRRLDRLRELGQEPPSLHSAVYYPDAEPTLETGVVTLVGAALHLLAPP
jgi:amidohydrolase